MDEQDLVCPACGQGMSAAEAGSGQCPHCGAALGRASAAGEEVPKDSVFGLRVSKWGNALQRVLLTPYAAVRGWSESVRALGAAAGLRGAVLRRLG